MCKFTIVQLFPCRPGCKSLWKLGHTAMCDTNVNMDLKRLEMHFSVSTKTVRYQFVLNMWQKRVVVNEYKIKATQKSGNKIILCHLLISE